MSSLRSATVALGLALWAVLALAPAVGACMDGNCAMETGARSAHCGFGGPTMLCCEGATSQPPEITIEGQRPAGLTAVVACERSAERHAGTGERAPTATTARHGPPLYSLFATLLI
ncbi:MAG: hypothetical protein OES32_04300 [Acidobacteriota bacterium]|nr:hypothetical protein [Acidobacteriota bacterium]MDH3522785.1 hypothetical protein [Acidobacteriota bacterium]